MKVVTIKPPHIYKTTERSITMFLAGSIEMGKAEMWQDDVTEFLSSGISNDKADELVIFNPRRDDWNNSWKQDESDPNFVEQVEWELEHIEKSDVVAFYLQPGTKSPISLMELGIVGPASFALNQRVVVLCPEGFHRKGNVDITAKWFDMHIAKDMDDFKRIIKQLVTVNIPNNSKEEIEALSKRLDELK